MINGEVVPHHPAGGDTSSNGCSAGGGLLIKLVRGDEIDRQCNLDAVLLCFGHQVLDDAGSLLIIQGGTDLRAARGKTTMNTLSRLAVYRK